MCAVLLDNFLSRLGDYLNERVLIIVGIIARYFLSEDDFSNEGQIIEELLGAGFEEEEISEAFSWMEKITLHPQLDQDEVPCLQPPALRLFAAQEQQQLSAAAQGFLVDMRQRGIINAEIEEEVILKACHECDEQVDLEEIRSLTVLILFANLTSDHVRTIDCIIENKLDKFYH